MTHRIASIVLAGVLLAAAYGKATTTNDLPWLSGALEQVVVFLAIALNVSLAAALLIRPRGRRVWVAGAAVFAAFALWSGAVEWLRPTTAAGCGCFGQLVAIRARDSLLLSAAALLACVWLLPRPEVSRCS